jgi:hypothetical protein
MRVFVGFKVFTAAHLLVLAEIISSTLKMEAICSSELSVATQQTTRRHMMILFMKLFVI